MARWWGAGADLAAVEAQYLPCLDGPDPKLFVLEADSAPAGFFQRYLARQ